ncbi:MAG: hypothetical protein K8T90_12700 [Planctomycetes bacterium]|nr:hypothetical protein [Planctomycetota bacterium]
MRHAILVVVLLAFVLVLVGGPAVADEAPTQPVERVFLIYFDCSGSMSGQRNTEALVLLDNESATHWATQPGALVVAVPFNNSHAVVAAGSDDAIRRLNTVAGVSGRIQRAPDAAALAAALHQMPCNGGTRLFDTILDTLPLVTEFAEADLTLEVISDGGDNASAHSEDETFVEIERLLTKKVWDNRFCDVYLRRYDRVNEALLAKFKEVAANSGGRLQVHATEMDEAAAVPAAPSLELNPTDVELGLDPGTEMLVTPQIRAELYGVAGTETLAVTLVEADGLTGVTASTATLEPGANVIVLGFSVDEAARPTFWSDCTLRGRVQITAGTVSGELWAIAVLPAGWRVFKKPVVLAGMGVGCLAVLVGLALLRKRTHGVSGFSRSATMPPWSAPAHRAK